MHLNETYTNDDKTKADLFNEYFGIPIFGTCVEPDSVNIFVNDNLSIIQLSVDDVYGVLLKLDISKCKWP
jgi:hypothetical protein